ncbi:MAG TPA: hypothetical protein VK756_04605 [Solirubrobacteraceae bacterium]|jgi:hypothetical protein|nr:hypothetical protein [Solirubrobacteraceae bacterium]
MPLSTILELPERELDDWDDEELDADDDELDLDEYDEGLDEEGDAGGL